MPVPAADPVAPDEHAIEDQRAVRHIDAAAVVGGHGVHHGGVAQRQHAVAEHLDGAAVVGGAAGQRDPLDGHGGADLENLAIRNVVAIVVAADRQQVGARPLDRDVAHQIGACRPGHADHRRVRGQRKRDEIVIPGLRKRVGERPGQAVIDGAGHEMVARLGLHLDVEGDGLGQQGIIPRAKREYGAAGIAGREAIGRVELIRDVGQRTQDRRHRSGHQIRGRARPDKCPEIAQGAFVGHVNRKRERDRIGVVAGQLDVFEWIERRRRGNQHGLLGRLGEIRKLRRIIDPANPDGEVVVLNGEAGRIRHGQGDHGIAFGPHGHKAGRRDELHGAQQGDQVGLREQRRIVGRERAEGGRRRQGGLHKLVAALVRITDEYGRIQRGAGRGVVDDPGFHRNTADGRGRLHLTDLHARLEHGGCAIAVERLEREVDPGGGGGHDPGQRVEKELTELGTDRGRVSHQPVGWRDGSEARLVGVRDADYQGKGCVAEVRIRQVIQQERLDRCAFHNIRR